MKLAGIILCGGTSQRMGLPKADLPFGPESMLARVARLLGSVTNHLVLVAAAGQMLPLVAGAVRVVHDQHPGRGPMEGLLAGLSALPADCDAAYVTSCDVPLLVPAFVTRMAELLGEHAIVMPNVGGYLHPLAAIYRPRVAITIATLLSQDQRRITALVPLVATRIAEAADLAIADPDFHTLKNLNHPSNYLEALAIADFAPDPAILARLKEE